MGSDELENALSLAGHQGQVLSKAQCDGLGLGPHAVRRLVVLGQWQRLAPGIYATHPELLSDSGVVWAGCLLGGPSAMAVGESAAALWKLTREMPEVVEIGVPCDRQVTPVGRWQFRRCRLIRRARGNPPRSVVVDTVLDLCEQQPDRAEHWVTEAVRSGITTRAALRKAVAGRRRVKGRQALLELLAEDQAGIESPLEGRYHRDVEQAHGLPASVRQVEQGDERQDMLYEFGLVVELDGKKGHTGEGRFRDMSRDNRNTARGLATLRYGWTDCHQRACLVAAQVAAMLGRLGWTGSLVRCPNCPDPGPGAA